MRTKADGMVVGERTVIHHAARYGILRGMTWTVILSALLFWLPVLGPATAGYVGGRKAGGPLRGVLAVAIPALVMLIILAAVAEFSGIVPGGLGTNVDINLDGLADLPSSSIPFLGGLERSIEAWVTASPDVFFIMGAFAIVGGALSALRRREEETVIEKVGIPLGELKERILKEEAARGGSPMPEAPSRWEPHPIISGPVAAHDAMNEMVEDIVARVVAYLRENEQADEAGVTTASGPRRKRRTARAQIPTGGEGPHYDELVSVSRSGATDGTPAKPTGARRTRASSTGSLTPRTAKEASMGGEGDWVVVNTPKGRRPVRVVRSRPSDGTGKGSPASPAVEGVAVSEPPMQEPQMRVETRRRGWFGKSKAKVVYQSDQGATPSSLTPPEAIRELQGPGAHAGAEEASFDKEAPAQPSQRNFERLPIIGPIMSEVEIMEGKVGTSGSLTSLDEPSVHDTMEAGQIADSAARELVEMARFEEGPEVEGEVDDGMSELSPETLVELVEEELEPEPAPAPKKRPKPKSTARKVRHPTGALRGSGRGAEKAADLVYEDDLAVEGTVDWNARDDHDEEEDLFNPRRLEDSDGAKGDEEAWAEEERIAAILRDRDEWDRL